MYALERAAVPALWRGISTSTVAAAKSWFGHVESAPADPILGVTVKYNEDPNPKKINLGVVSHGYCSCCRHSRTCLCVLRSFVMSCRCSKCAFLL